MTADSPRTAPQGFGPDTRERMPLPDAAVMTPAQREAAQALIDSPRKAVYGPFVALLRSPPLLDRVARLGESLRFDGALDPRVRELAICAVARHVSNQFEWVMHAPLAIQAGVSAEAIEALRTGARPAALAQDEAVALAFVHELLATHGAGDATYARTAQAFGEEGIVELTTLVGYFAMVSWVMNVARTPSLASTQAPLPGLPA
jgi:4-carboxymuconolactone decarboxylase